MGFVGQARVTSRSLARLGKEADPARDYLHVGEAAIGQKSSGRFTCLNPPEGLVGRRRAFSAIAAGAAPAAWSSRRMANGSHPCYSTTTTRSASMSSPSRNRFGRDDCGRSGAMTISMTVRVMQTAQDWPAHPCNRCTSPGRLIRTEPQIRYRRRRSLRRRSVRP
jgi:hypothetical protein